MHHSLAHGYKGKTSLLTGASHIALSSTTKHHDRANEATTERRAAGLDKSPEALEALPCRYEVFYRCTRMLATSNPRHNQSYEDMQSFLHSLQILDIIPMKYGMVFGTLCKGRNKLQVSDGQDQQSSIPEVCSTIFRQSVLASV